MEKDTVTIESIKSFDLDRLAKWLYKEAFRDRRLHNSLEQLLLSGDQQKLTKAIKNEIAGIKRSRKFIHYGDSFDYARKLEDLLDRITEVENPKTRLELLESFIQTDEKVYERTDDSAGVIQSVYREAENIWCDNAGSLDEDALYKSLMKLRVCKGYGTRNIFGHFVPKTVLERIYNELYQKVKNPIMSKYDTFDDMSTMNSCAHYLKSPEKYIEAIEAVHGEVPDYMTIDVAREYLYANMPKKCIDTLESMRQIPPNNTEEYFIFLIEAYSRLGDEEAVTKVYDKWYKTTHNPSVLQEYLKRLDPKREQKILDKALKDAEKMGFTEAMRFFKTMDAKELAVKYIFDHQNELQTDYMYTNEFKSLVKWLSDGYPEAAILLYRHRTESTLQSAQSKYYPWVIRHLESMVKLANDANIVSWTIESNFSYIKRLVKTHERKTKFQSLLKQSSLLEEFLSEV